MAGRYVNYDDLLKKWHDLGFDEISRIHKVNAFNHFIKNLPTADVAEVVHGEWVDNGIRDSMLSKCSVCGFPCGAYTFNYCPNCGAKMDGDEP